MEFRRTITAIFILLTLCFGVIAQLDSSSANQSPLPSPTGMVNDFANIIDDNVQNQIEQKLRNFKERTNPQVEIAVVTVKTTGERPIFDYSLAIARGWKIGTKDDDNPSALLVVAVDDRKYFTQISKDLEDELPDGILGQLQRQYLVPAFRQQNYTKGINDTIDAFIKTIEERKSAPAGTPKSNQSDEISLGTVFCCIIIIIVIIVLLIIFSSFGRGGGKGSGSGRDRWRGGGFGGGPPIIVWGGGGDSSSSWGSSGGDSWGGFGGGGDFGGGGAGGDW